MDIKIWELSILLVFFILGIILIAIDIFLPGTFILGVVGSISVLISLSFLIAKSGNNTKLRNTAIVLLVLFIIVYSVIIFLIRSLFKGKLNKNNDIVETGKAVDMDKSKVNEVYKQLVGKKGITMSYLRPVGRILVNNSQYDAISLDGIIEKGKEIEIIKIENYNLMVQEIKK